MKPPRRRYARRLSPTERREQLLDTALALVVESGYGALSMHRPGAVTSIFTSGEVVYGFALTLPTEPVCR